MKILDSSKSLSVLVNDSTNGLGTIQPLECTVTEELNGIYECEFTVLTTDKHYEDLKNSGLIKVMVGDGSEQIFRVYFISEPINFVVTVKAQHISYDLSKIVVKPFTATGAVNVKNQLVSHILGSYPFTTWTDITNTTSTFALDIPRSFRECLGGYEGSVLDVFRCEYEWDNLTVKMYARRGADNGVRIAYGKNLTDFVQEQNNENVYDGVYGYAVVDEVTYEASNYYNKTGATTPKILNVDFSSDYETGQVPTAADLLAKATTYAQNNPIEVPSVNIKIDFIPLWQTEEYKDILQLERVSLGDTVHVYFDKLNVEASSRVIKTVWNVLTNKYDSIELGDAKANMNTVINQSVQQAVKEMDVDVGWLDEKLEAMTTLIANGLGLHISQDDAGRIILHNAETIADSQYQYMITAQGFMLSENYGQTWSSGWTTSGDAVLNSLSTITLRALEIYGSYIQGTQIVFGDPSDSSNKYITVSPNTDGVVFDGTGSVRIRPRESFVVDNVMSDNVGLYNKIWMRHSTTDGYESSGITIFNYNPNNRVIGNQISMSSGQSSTGLYSSMAFGNVDVANGTTANELTMSFGTNTNRIALTNYFHGTSQMSSQIYMDSSNGSAGVINVTGYDTSGSSTGSIVINESQMLISGKELRISSSGALYISSTLSQDIHIIAADDLYLNASDKFYWNNRQVGFITVVGQGGTTYSVIGAV